MPTAHQSEVPEPDSMTIDPANLGSVDPLSVEGIFLVALGKTGAEREAFLGAQCVDDDQRQRVEALLGAYEKAGNFLQKPAVAAEPTPIGQYLAPCELPGTLGRLGPYEILEEIGRGGMGVVFRAHDPKLQRIVAVKALAPELARLPSARQRFLREARAAAAISHPHVVTIFAVEGTEEASLGTERTTLPFLVMECIVGQTLHDKIKRVGALRLEEIIRISRQMAEGLAAAHKRGLIHRDIKPANILLENGVERVKITDFGLARTTADGGITHTGEILGTPQCMSPEQARGEIVDQRSDLFSLGCVMYTMCTGVSPFRGDNILAVMKKVCEETARPVAQLNPAIPEWLCDLVHRLLRKEPERRIQTAGEVVETLEARAMASSPGPIHVVHSSAASTATQFAPADSEAVPRWLLTPIIPGLEQWLFKDYLLPVTLIAMVIGFFLGENRESKILMLPVLGFLGIGLFALVKVVVKAPWNWINWKSVISVPLGMFVGGISRAWFIVKSQSGAGLLEELARNNAGWFVFPLAIAIFWLLTRCFRDLFTQTLKSVPDSEAAPARSMHWSTWVILAMTVIVVGLLALSPPRGSSAVNITEPALVVYIISLNAWAFVHLVAWGMRLAGSKDRIPNAAFEAAPVAPATNAAVPARSPWSILGWMIVAVVGFVILATGVGLLAIAIPAYQSRQAKPITMSRIVLDTHGETIAKVTVDGQEIRTLETNADVHGRSSFLSHAGPHTLHIEYVSDNPQQEKFYHSTLNVFGGTTVVDAAATISPIIIKPPATAEVSAFSIPLADAVEVLTDPKTMPSPVEVTMSGGFGGQILEMAQAVWIDEPGLLIRMKRLGFEGEEGTEIEYYSKVAWGTGPFMGVDETVGEIHCHFPAGRYRVLVQDLDYGWQLDRRGTITIGNGPIYVHVKRTFQAHQKLSSGSDRFPLPFRWAGKTYQIHTPEEVQHVDILLSYLNQGDGMRGVAKDSSMFAVIQGFQDRQFVAEAIEMSPEDGSARLKRERSVMKIDVRSPGLKFGFKTALGQIEWNSLPVCVKPSCLNSRFRGFCRTILWGCLARMFPSQRTSWKLEPGSSVVISTPSAGVPNP